jgi:hypothetical protein
MDYAKSRFLRKSVETAPNPTAPITPAISERNTVIIVELSVATLAAG